MIIYATLWTLKFPKEGDSPLLVLTGEEYARITFEELHAQLCHALRGDRSPVVMEILNPDGTQKIIRDKGDPNNPAGDTA